MQLAADATNSLHSMNGVAILGKRIDHKISLLVIMAQLVVADARLL